MCRNWTSQQPCMDFKCHHNVFWEGLNLRPGRIHQTKKAREIRNCCCLIYRPWTPEEIGEVWGVRTKRIMQCEKVARGKVMSGGRPLEPELGW
jgi:hypothetical protein